MQKLCCVRTRQHPLSVWSHNLSLTNLLISPSILNHFRWELYQTVFVDQASHMGFIYLQKTCSAEETIEAKRAFEQYAESQGVRVRAYLADNGIFKAKKWVEECRQRKQDLTFSGVNAHHQNGIAE